MAARLGRIGLWCFWISDGLVISEVWLSTTGWVSWLSWVGRLLGWVSRLGWVGGLFGRVGRLLSWASWLLERVGGADLLVLADRSALGADRLGLSGVSGSVDSCLRLHVDGLDWLLDDRGVRLLERGRVGPWQLRLDGSTDVRINQDGREVCRGDGLYKVSEMQPKAGQCSHTSTFWVLVLISVSY